MIKTCFNFQICQLYQHIAKSLYNTACKIIESRHENFNLLGSQYIDDVPVLKIHDEDDKKSAIHKTLKCFIYHLKNNTQFDYFFLGDDDTFIDFKNYDKFLKSLDPNDLALHGKIAIDGNVTHIYGGTGIVLNRKTFLHLATHIKKKYITHRRFSDISLALNVHDYNNDNQEQIKFINNDHFLGNSIHLPRTENIITCHVKGYLKKEAINYQNKKLNYYDLYKLQLNRHDVL